MVSVAPTVTRTASITNKLGSLKKSIGLGGIATAAFCIFDFLDVPKTFNSKYNSKGEKIEGKNWSGALKEVGKSIPKCLSAIALPIVIGAATMGAGPVVATLGGIAALAAPMLSYSMLEKILPHESEVIAEACKEKGIDISPETSLTSNMNLVG